jgi:hypothetical protein
MKWKFQFSLSSLLWLTLCLALLLTSVLMYRRMADAEHRMVQAEAEAALMRKAAGYLVIGDRKLVHGFKIATHEEFRWRWRLFIPSGHDYSIKVASGDLPQEGIPDHAEYDEPMNYVGEIVVCADVEQSKVEDKYVMTLSIWNEKLDLVRGTYCPEKQRNVFDTSIPISASAIEKLHVGPVEGRIEFGDGGTQTSDPNQPIILLSRILIPQDGDASAPGPGIMIWLEEQKKP